MTNPKRKFRGNDATQRFLRDQQEQRDLDFKAIEARYRNEIITRGDGTTVTVREEITEARDHHVVPREALKPIEYRRPRVGPESADDLLELAIAQQPHIVSEAERRREEDAEIKQALRDRGVTFSREPKSIHASVPQGRIGSIPKPKIRSKRKEVDNRSIQTPDRSIDQFLSRKGLTPQFGNRH